MPKGAKNTSITNTCPFCGSDATVSWELDPYAALDESSRFWFGECLHCAARGPVASDERTALNRWAFRGKIDLNKEDAPFVEQP